MEIILFRGSEQEIKMESGTTVVTSTKFLLLKKTYHFALKHKKTIRIEWFFYEYIFRLNKYSQEIVHYRSQ